MNDVKVDVDFVRCNIVFDDGAFSRDPDRLVVGREMVNKICSPSFLSLMGSNAVCTQHPKWYDSAKLKNRFSTGQNFNSAGKHVPPQISTWEIVVCTGAIELSMSMQTVDVAYLDDEFYPDITNDATSFTVEHVVNTLQLKYPSCALNVDWAKKRLLFSPGCLDNTHVNFIEVLIAVCGGRPKMIGMVLLVGAKSSVKRDADISMMNAVEHFFAWLKEMAHYRSTFEVHVVRMDFGFSQPAVHYPVRWASTGESVKRNKVFVNMPYNKKAEGYHVEKNLFSIFNAAEPHGGVNIKFKNPFGEHSPAPVSLIKSYISIAHYVRRFKQFCNPNLTNLTFAKKSVKETAAYGYTCYLILHNIIRIIMIYGLVARFEATVESPYDHFDKDGKFVKIPDNINDMKVQDLEVWLEKAMWAYKQLLQGNLNLTIMRESQSPTVEGLMKTGYYKIGQLFSEIQRRATIKIGDCVPQPSGQLWLNSVLAMIQAVCGISGNSIHKNWKKPFDAPPESCYDPYGELYLSNSTTDRHLTTDMFRMANNRGQKKINMSRFAYNAEDQQPKTRRYRRDTEKGRRGDINMSPEVMIRKNKFVHTAVQNEYSNKQKMLTAASRKTAGPLFKLMQLEPLYVSHRALLKKGLPSCAWMQTSANAFDQRFIMIIPPRTCGVSSDMKGVQLIIKRCTAMGVGHIIPEIKSYVAPVTPDSCDDRDMQQPTVEAIDIDQAAIDVQKIHLRKMRRVKDSYQWYEFHASKVKDSTVMFAKKRSQGRMVCLKQYEIGPETGTEKLSERAIEILDEFDALSTTKRLCYELAIELNIASRDLKDNRKITSHGVLDRIWQCYTNKFPTIFDLDSDNDSDNSDGDDSDEDVEQGGYGFDGLTPESEMPVEVTNWIAQRKARAVDSRSNNIVTRNQRRAVLDEEYRVCDIVYEAVSRETTVVTPRRENDEDSAYDDSSDRSSYHNEDFHFGTPGSPVVRVNDSFDDEDRFEYHCV